MKSRKLAAITLAFGALLTHTAFAATKISQCQTIAAPGSYLVVNNLQSGSTPCLKITASDVTVDLGGFTLTGNGSADGVTDAIGPSGSQRAITVKNGIVQKMRFAVAFTSTDGAMLDGLDVSQSAGGISLLRGQVTNSIVHNNSGAGIEAFEAAIVQNNVVVDNSGNGLVAGPASVISDNVVDHNGNGIVATGNASGTNNVEGAVIRRNVVRGNTGVGLSASCPSLIDTNAVNFNTSGQIQAGGACVFITNTQP